MGVVSVVVVVVSQVVVVVVAEAGVPRRRPHARKRLREARCNKGEKGEGELVVG